MLSLRAKTEARAEPAFFLRRALRPSGEREAERGEPAQRRSNQSRQIIMAAELNQERIGLSSVL